MKNSIKITSLCLIGCLYTTVGLADDKKAIWGTDGQAITKKPTTPVQTLKPKTEAQINPKKVETMSGMSGMGGMAGKDPQINPKPQTDTISSADWGIAISDTAPQINPKPQVNTMSGMDGMSGKKPQINPKPQTVKDAKPIPVK